MKVITLNPNEFTHACVRLQQLIASAGVHPDVVIGIASGGDFVAQEMFPQLPHSSVTLRRPSTARKERKWVKTVVRALPLWLRDRLRLLEAKRLARKTPKPMTTESIQLPDLSLNATTILMVDDAVDSGVTLRTVVQAIKQRYPQAEVLTAVLNVTTLNPLIKPDFVLYPQAEVLIRFPWSIDYR
ncbi:MAG: phosphoribosyltransferase domain-containing protein [Muribaculaceae bacterium]|nr:phosphoribosyltransferase domain-containing protein [Muribaculaceae bacterium]MDE5967621.1 phosphoribosyltransferase domain-containing protein [Muribaculaceae bacterium]MDE7394469.1 phosphoribosyltransferase domain-containing protein [Muribaculaceae bacterium]